MIDELEVAGRPVAVCGGSAHALPVITTLVARGARLTIYAESVATTVADLADRGELVWQRRKAVSADLERAALVVTASGDSTADEQVIRAAADVRTVVLRTGAPVDTAVPPIADGAGSVVLVGGGPGDPGLLTVAGLEALRTADVIVTDRLAPVSALAEARPDAVIIDVAKVPRGRSTPQEAINDLLVQHARSGRRVVRLKGGDSFVFGRGGEEWQACAAAGIPVTVIPGVTSAVAGPALAGIPLTHRTLTQGFTVVSGHLPPGDPGSTLDWAALARANTTLVIMMGLATLPMITAELIRSGLDEQTPAVTVASAGLPGQQTVHGTVASIAAHTEHAGLRPPAITVIGAVAGFRP
jgi:uroporphyrin-III C-methyltransferase